MTTERCDRCYTPRDTSRLFCRCGKLMDREALQSIRLPGEIGVQKLDEFWETGDPNTLVRTRS